MADRFTEEQIAEFYSVFAQYDRQDEGQVSVRELPSLMMALGQNPTEATLKRLLAETDTDDLGIIDFPQLLSMLSHTIRDLESEEELRQAFKIFDKDGNGTISAEELHQAMASLGEQITDGEIAEMIREADKDGDGQVDYEEFISVMFTS